MYFGDIVIRIDETLDDEHVRELEFDLGGKDGIYGAHIHEKRRHLLVVDYDPDRVQPDQIVQSVRNRGLHADMISL
jgi:hypothetical protein